ncbi:hypothetical protein MUN88_00980 [Gracilibacillus caseinilyticus]|uniref:Cytochrome c oxidase subunit 4 n=1 Tax=Gracilibacillus caseinilyticus TaxID=2932256 RepID=A0ABY4F2N0_9BACI|nr:hypothetical protein [Gracilibacillus caseinilyticus]UOQ50480.1 hypothetical protein MUN88_00980 [Gracilibacillus caseinilyticus]
MDWGLFNLGSLILGLVAWTLPVINLVRYKNNDYRNWGVLAVISISACAISLYFQIVYDYHLVEIEDWSALMDTSGAVVRVGGVLLIGTLLLNAITVIVCLDRSAK